MSSSSLIRMAFRGSRTVRLYAFSYCGDGRIVRQGSIESASNSPLFLFAPCFTPSNVSTPLPSFGLLFIAILAPARIPPAFFRLEPTFRSRSPVVVCTPSVSISTRLSSFASLSCRSSSSRPEMAVGLSLPPSDDDSTSLISGASSTGRRASRGRSARLLRLASSMISNSGSGCAV